MRALLRRPRPLRTPLLAGLTLALVALAPTASLGQDTPTVYRFTLKKFELCSDNACTTSVVLPGTTEQLIDLGSAVAVPFQKLVTFEDAGLDDAGLPIDSGFEFTNVRITFSRNFTASATAAATTSFNGAACVTTADPAVVVSSATQETATVDASLGLGLLTFVVPDSFEVGPLTIDAGADTVSLTGAFPGGPFTTGSDLTVSLSFDVQNQILFTQVGAGAPDNCTVRLGTPNISIGISEE